MRTWVDRQIVRLDRWLLDSYLLHHLDVLLATQRSDVKGEFGITITATLLLAPAMAHTLAVADPGVGSALLYGLTVIFVLLANRRQRLLARYLPLSSRR